MDRPRSNKGPPKKPPPKRPASSPDVPPPPPAPKPKDELAEVERALSVLGGHHPEHERATREVKEAQAKKRALDEVELEKRRKRALKRGAIGAGIAGALALLVWQLATHHAHTAAVERALDAPTARLAPRGFSAVATGERALEEQADPGCYAAVAPDSGDAKLDVEHGGETLSGEGSLGWCACEAEKIAVRGAGPLRVLRVDARAVGNLDGLAAMEPRPRVLSTRVEDCAAEQFDAWLGDKKISPAPVDVAAFDGDAALAPLQSAGFVPIAALPEGRAFAPVDAGAASCFLAWSTTKDDTLTLRASGGERPIANAPGAIGWCSEEAQLVTVWRQGKGAVTVAAVASARVSGMLGLRERAARANLGALTAWIAQDKLAWDAAQALLGAAIGEGTPVLAGNDAESKPAGDARVVAMSLAPGGAFAADRRGDIAYACAPKIDATTLETVCAQLAPQTWRQTGVLGALGIASAPLPFWLSVFSPVKDPDLVKALVPLLTLARRLHADGFEPTTLAGVVEEASGVTVVGRAGDDAIVAVGLGARAPWVFPYSDGADWALDAEPRVVELKPGERVELASTKAPTMPKEERRTVVFRRRAKK